MHLLFLIAVVDSPKSDARGAQDASNIGETADARETESTVCILRSWSRGAKHVGDRLWGVSTVLKRSASAIQCYTHFFSTRSFTQDRHSSTVRPPKRATTTTVMLSQPMPPVSESVARHLTMRSSQIFPISSPLATARRTKSTTC